MNNYLRKLYDAGKLIVLSPDADFDPDYQIEPDAVNLRLHPKAMRLKPDLQQIDLLDSEAHIIDYFEAYDIPWNGLELKPNELIFCKTLETVSLQSDHHIGLMFGRRTIAGFGISITLDQPKFPSGLPWNFPLQIKNNTVHTVKIYPYMYIAQLILIEYPSPAFRNYRGIYKEKIDNFFPSVDENEQKSINFYRLKLQKLSANEVNHHTKIHNLLEQKKVVDSRNKFLNKWGKDIIIQFADYLFLLSIAGAGAIIAYDFASDNFSGWKYTYFVIALISAILIKILLKNKPSI